MPCSHCGDNRALPPARELFFPINRFVILRFSAENGPGYFASFLDAQAFGTVDPVRHRQGMIRLPDRSTTFSGLVLMGGPMSANDALPWIPQVLALIRRNRARDTPVLGHSYGWAAPDVKDAGRTGHVECSQRKSVGSRHWPKLTTQRAIGWAAGRSKHARISNGGRTELDSAGRNAHLTGRALRQSGIVAAASLGMQCHIEMAPDMVQDWCEDWNTEGVGFPSSVEGTGADYQLASTHAP